MFDNSLTSCSCKSSLIFSRKCTAQRINECRHMTRKGGKIVTFAAERDGDIFSLRHEKNHVREDN